jgi:hypothetical protein
LAVESFEANTVGADSRGTVNGQAVITGSLIVFFTDLYSCWDWSCCDAGSCVAAPAEA